MKKVCRRKFSTQVENKKHCSWGWGSATNTKSSSRELPRGLEENLKNTTQKSDRHRSRHLEAARGSWGCRDPPPKAYRLF